MRYVLDVFALVLLGDGDVATARLELELLHDAERLVVDRERVVNDVRCDAVITATHMQSYKQVSKKP